MKVCQDPDLTLIGTGFVLSVMVQPGQSRMLESSKRIALHPFGLQKIMGKKSQRKTKRIKPQWV